MFLDADELYGVMENYGYWQAMDSRFLVLRFEMHASQIQGCIVEHRVEKKGRSQIYMLRPPFWTRHDHCGARVVI